MVLRVLTPILFLVIFSGWTSFAVQAQVKFFNGDIKEMQNEAKMSRTPYFMYFFVDDCEECEAMRSQTFTYAPLTDYTQQNYLAYEVDGLDFGTGIDIATRYGVKRYPTVMVFGPDGEVRNRTEGFIGGGDLLNLLTQSVRPTDRNLSNRVISPRAIPGNETPAGTATRGLASNEGSWTSTMEEPANTPYKTSETMLNNKPDSKAAEAGAYKGNYMDAYMSNQLKTYSDYNYGQASASSPTSGTEPGKKPQTELDYSYIDDRKRPTYQEATRSGYTPGRSESPTPTQGVTQPQDYGSYSYIDDYQKKGYTPSTGSGKPVPPTSPQPQQPGNQQPVQVSGEPSFLDPLGATYEQPTATRGMDEATLRRTESSYTEYPDYYPGTASRSLGEALSEQPEMAAAPKAPAEKSVVKIVPGFSDYSTEDIKTNTFGIVVGEYVKLADLQKDIDKIETQRKDAKLWVYSEKVNNVHHFKLVFGEFKGEQEAVNEGLRLGAGWDQIEVVNLAKLR